MRTAALVFALLLLGLLVLAPLGQMALDSVRVDELVLRDGKHLRGHVQNRDSSQTTIRVAGEEISRQIPATKIASSGRIFSLAHYHRLLGNPAQRGMLLATLVLAGASTLLAFLLGLPIGLLFSATDLPGRRYLEILSVLPLVLPPILLAIAAYRDLLGVHPAFLRAVLVFGLSLFPLVSLFTARAVRATGREALDAARLQTTPGDALLRVALGPALPGAAAGALLVFVFVVADFAVPDFLGVTTAKNTIRVYANAVYAAWNNDGNAGAAAAAGMPPTLLALGAFAGVLVLEARRGASTIGSRFRELAPLPLGRGRWPALALVLLVLSAALVLPAVRNLETASGAHFGSPVARGGATTQVVDTERARPVSVWDGLRKGLRHENIGTSSLNSLLLAGGGALLAVLLALLLTEAGRAYPRLDKLLLVAAFLPIAVPPMSLAVGWVEFFGPARASQRYFPILLMGARLLPFAALAVRAARFRVGEELLEAASLAGLAPGARTVRITLPLVAPGALLGLLLAFLFGLREVDALVFTRTGSKTLPVQLYNMIHYGFDVQVAALSLLWTACIGLLLLLIAFVAGPRFRILP